MPTNDPKVHPHDLFEILVREHESRLRAFVGAFVRDQNALDDIVQDAFLVAWRNLDRYDRSRPFGPWLRGIARRLALAHYRKVSDKRLAFVDAQAVDELAGLYERLESAPGDTFEEQLASLRKCLERLSGHQREVLTLHYEEDLACGEIAESMGRSREAVKKLLQRSRAWLGQCIEQRLSALDSHTVGGRA